MMKRILVFSLVLMGAALASSGAETDSSGPGFAVSFFDRNPGIQARYHVGYPKSENSEFALQASAYFNSGTRFRFDADYHYIINPGETVRIYPLAGAEFAARKNYHRWGINVGGGMDIGISEKITGFLELKYVIGDWDGVGFTVGVLF